MKVDGSAGAAAVSHRTRGVLSGALCCALAAAASALTMASCEESRCGGGGIPCCAAETSADLSGADWGLGETENHRYGVYMRAAGDTRMAVMRASLELVVACEAMADVMGVAARDVDGEATAAARAEAACGRAAQGIAALRSAMEITPSFADPRCAGPTSAQVACEASCAGDSSCSAELGDLATRCPPGELAGVCAGTCEGACEGDAGPVTCLGECEGTCRGACDGTCNFRDGEACNGRCVTTCDGTCFRVLRDRRGRAGRV